MSGDRCGNDLFFAIAHPVRRALLEECLMADEVAVSALAEVVGSSASALSQHLRVLKDVGLVAARKEGRNVYYRITPEPLLEIIEFARTLEVAWTRRLDALGEYLDRTANAVKLDERSAVATKRRAK